MKVLQINTVCGTGSTGRIATDIHRILIDQGHESYIAYGRGAAIGCDMAIRIGNSYDLYMHVLLTRMFDRHGFGSRRATRAFIETIDRLDPDVIHLHNVHGYYVNIDILFEFLKSTSKPVVWTLHDCWPFTGHCSHFEYANCNKWVRGCHSCPLIQEYPRSALKDNSKRNYLEKMQLFGGIEDLTIITPSRWLKNLVERSFLKEYPIKVIHNGIDIETFQPETSDFRQKLGLADKFIILGVAGIWGRGKGYNQFLTLAETVEADEVIVLVGVTDKQKADLPRNVIGIKHTTKSKELAYIYSAADVFVNPTREDTFPTTNLEALACGTPVITYDVGGAKESIDESTGIVVESQDICALRGCINEVKKNGKLKYNMACVSRARELFDKNRMSQDYLDVYKRRQL